MPFTLSHPAAVVPLSWLHSRGLVFSALVMGSMAPDFDKFLILAGVEGHRSYGHSLEGLFTFCLPLSLALLWIFHHVMKRPLVWLLPVGHRARLAPLCGYFHFLPPRRFLAICGSILLGAWTHLACDALTHRSEVSTVLGFDFTVKITDHLYVAFFDVLQWLLSLLGLALLAYWYAVWYRSQSLHVVPRPIWVLTLARLTCIAILFVIPPALGIGYGTSMIDPYAQDPQSLRFAQQFIWSGLASWAILLLLYSIAFKVALWWIVPRRSKTET